LTNGQAGERIVRTMSHFATRLHAAIRSKRTPALIGLDPRYNSLPAGIVEQAEARNLSSRYATIASAYEEFCCRLVDVVAPLVPAVKPQAAFFEEQGPAGCRALERVIRHARSAGLIVICDAKRGDIGSTAEAYARAYLAGADPNAAVWGADALTVNPYLGSDTLEPFIQTAVERDGGIYVLVRTSNPGAGTFQDRISENRPMYQHVAECVERAASETSDGEGFGCVGGVVGATYPEELVELRSAMPHVPLLIPGYGSQGGTAEDVAGGFLANGLGSVVNSSRGINFAHAREPFASQFGAERWEEAVEEATKQMIDDLAAHTPAGVLRNEVTS
jgi:orotidine-5'-phosphate decarboxylase